MLPSYNQPSGGITEEDSKRSALRGPLLNVKKQIGRSAPQPAGLIILTVACSLLLLVQVCPCMVHVCECSGMRERGQPPAGTASAASRRLPPPTRSLARATRLSKQHCLQCHPAPVDLSPQLWYSTGIGSRRASSSDGITPSQRRALASARRATAAAAASAGRRFFPAPQLRNLVLVACHSVYTGLDFHDSEQRSSWFLLDYQKARRRVEEGPWDCCWGAPGLR
jgi:hypothetical protein